MTYTVSSGTLNSTIPYHTVNGHSQSFDNGYVGYTVTQPSSIHGWTRPTFNPAIYPSALLFVSQFRVRRSVDAQPETQPGCSCRWCAWRNLETGHNIGACRIRTLLAEQTQRKGKKVERTAPLRERSPYRSAQVYGTCSQVISQFYLHTNTFISSRNGPYLALPAIAGIHLPIPEGWKVELALGGWLRSETV